MASILDSEIVEYFFRIFYCARLFCFWGSFNSYSAMMVIFMSDHNSGMEMEVRSLLNFPLSAYETFFHILDMSLVLMIAFMVCSAMISPLTEQQYSLPSSVPSL
eukprot:15326908-Ditylum_brightwellii.AAC.1